MRPAWLEDLIFKYRSSIANLFVLHFNVNDYAGPDNRRVRDVVIQDFLENPAYAPKGKPRRVVAIYNRAEGITFARPGMREEFIRILTGERVGPEDPIKLPVAPGQAFALLDRLIYSEPAAVLIEQAETVLPAEDLAHMDQEELRALTFVKKWAGDVRLNRMGSPVVLLAGSLAELHPHLRLASTKIETILVPLPDLEARLNYIEAMVEKRKLELAVDIQDLANATAGLSRILIEDIGLRAEATGQPVTLDFVRDRKESLIRAEFGDVLEIVEPRFDFTALGGLTEAKLFAARNIVVPLRTGNYRRVPLGVLLTGPSGTGKSAFFYALVAEAGVNGVKLNFGKILGPYVGLSEQNLEKALLGIQSLAPCLVLIDEIDQLLQRGSGGDSGVQQRLFARMLDFMSNPHNRGRIVFVAATNRPDLIDPALKRPGRFDRKIPFLLPGWAERVAILQAVQKRYGMAGEPDWEEAARRTEGYTGAELESVVLKAWELAEDAGRAEITREDIEGALERIRPSTAQVEFMTDLAILECDDKDVLPPEFRDLLDDRRALEERVQRYKLMNLR
ncbi:ATP-binding protein [Symbiobacterium thermophilum]|uniref:ATP-binding protein n=2 Tax=Symbiobacterium thermophilum TaxID=2734 RepID=A0A953I6X8_SYMTR|nr:ATP-binding protein [Symbiobacterium thermophilum]MBY6275084.1 ATP-binding protein [Symbiobacterium thermophilum]BAD40371.1 putative cell division control protein [Symbiobacterium thermophilum IAM 14863]